jgi:hypothetical protein
MVERKLIVEKLVITLFGVRAMCAEVLKTNSCKFLPEFHKAISESFQVWESNLAKGKLSQSGLGSRSKMQFDLRRWDVLSSNQKDL